MILLLELLIRKFVFLVSASLILGLFFHDVIIQPFGTDLGMFTQPKIW